MPDFPGAALQPGAFVLSTYRTGVPPNTKFAMNATSSLWPSANRALYMPVEVETPVTVKKLAFHCASATGEGARLRDGVGRRAG